MEITDKDEDISFLLVESRIIYYFINNNVKFK